jgi:hypothetical protein
LIQSLRKPIDVDLPITILELTSDRPVADLKEVLNEGWKSDVGGISDDWTNSVTKGLGDLGRMKTMHYLGGSQRGSMKFSMAAGCLFGSIHCIAWNFVFPTRTEVIMWRVAAVASTAMPLLLLLTLQLGHLTWRFLDWFTARNQAKDQSRHLTMWEVGFAIVYGVSRFYLMVASFTSFRSQPARIYAAVDWARYIPHFT